MAKADFFIPPGGFAGFAQQTPAVQALLRKKKTKKKRRAKKGIQRVPKTKRSSPKKKIGRLVKGSPEARRRMAQIRNKRK